MAAQLNKKNHWKLYLLKLQPPNTWIIQYFIYEYFLDLIGKYLLKLQAPNFGWRRSVVAAVVQVAVVLVLAMPVMPWARWYNGDHTLKQAQ